MNREEKIKYIAEYFGLAQEQKIIEEAGELITELSRLQQQVMLVALGKAEIDENATFSIRILGFVDGKPVKDKTVSFTYSQVGCVTMGLVEDDPNEGYYYNDYWCNL